MIEKRSRCKRKLAAAPFCFGENGSVHELCLLQSSQDERDEDELGDDAGHSGEQRTRQEGREAVSYTHLTLPTT